jgi:hypothetical protein
MRNEEACLERAAECGGGEEVNGLTQADTNEVLLVLLVVVAINIMWLLVTFHISRRRLIAELKMQNEAYRQALELHTLLRE